MIATINRVKYITPLFIGVFLQGCLGIGESVGSSSSTVRTSIVPASVPYYLDLCGQSNDKTYQLYAPAAMGDWKEGVGAPDRKKAMVKREECIKARRIENGDPITVRLHRVGIGGLATFDDKTGKCKKGCKRDIAVVLDFNGSATLQKPIVAFYQTDVAPDSNLQFVNQIIFSQNEWFYRYPPSVRVRLYDVRDDKDAALRSNLENVKKGASLISQYIAGAAIAGPIIDTAISAADQLISAPRNRSIMDMSFQLFPDEQQDPGRTETDAKEDAGAVASREKPPVRQISAAELNQDEIRRVQQQIGMPKQQQDGILGRKTYAALSSAEPRMRNLEQKSTAFNQAIRAILAAPPPEDAARYDATFGSPIYASQFIVFDEGAREGGGCKTTAIPNARARMGDKLPTYYFSPDGVRYGGARVYAYHGGHQCVLDASFVTFSITKESANVAADVAKRISDLQTKFTANQAVSEDAVAALTSARVDAELALAIDRVENMRRADRLRAMILKLGTLIRDAGETASADRTPPPLPGAGYRSRAYRLIKDYLGCAVNDQTTPGQLSELADELATQEWQKVFREGAIKPYFQSDIDKLHLVCPGIPTTKTNEPAITPPAAPSPAREIGGM